MPGSMRALLFLIALLPASASAQSALRLNEPGDWQSRGETRDDHYAPPREATPAPFPAEMQRDSQVAAQPSLQREQPTEASPPAPTPQTRPLPARGQSNPIPLAPPGNTDRSREDANAGKSGGAQSLVTIGSSLAIVLGLFFVVAWMMRRTTPGVVALLPSPVLEVLGRAPLGARQQVHLIRLGNKLVLLSVTPAGVESLSEVTEPEEVDRLTGLCRQSQPNSSTAVFQQIMRQFSGESRTPAGTEGRHG